MATKPNKPYVGDVGTVILMDTGQLLTDATVTNILVKKPYGAEEVWVGQKYTDNKSVQFATLPHGENGYQECGLIIDPAAESGLITNSVYNFTINGILYTYIAGAITTYQGVVDDLNNIFESNNANIEVSIINGDIRFTHKINHYKNTINLAHETGSLFTALTGFLNFQTPVKPVVASFDVGGVYNLQAYIETPSFKGRGQTAELEVYDKFK